MYAFINVIKKDHQVRVKIIDMLDRYMRLPYIYQSKIGYDTLIQKVILKELINIMSTTIIELDKELKMKISRIKYLENKKTYKIVIYIDYLRVKIHFDQTQITTLGEMIFDMYAKKICHE